MRALLADQSTRTIVSHFKMASFFSNSSLVRLAHFANDKLLIDMISLIAPAHRVAH